MDGNWQRRDRLLGRCFHKRKVECREMAVALGRNQRRSDPSQRGRRRRDWVCLAAGRDACVKVNESRSEFADKEENTEFLAKLGEVEEGGENGEKDNKKIVCVIVCTRNGHEMGLIGQSTAVDLISVILPSAFIVSPIRVFSSQSSIVPLPQG